MAEGVAKSTPAACAASSALSHANTLALLRHLDYTTLKISVCRYLGVPLRYKN